MNLLKAWWHKGWLVFLALPLVYYLAFAWMGFADTDQGFIPALAYRISIGQLPYLDFDYVRPPLSPMLHSLELLAPDHWQMRLMRLDFYLMMWLSSLFGILALRKTLELEKIENWMGWIGSLAFIFSVHNFAPMPWHTVDGIFFGSLGIWLLTRQGPMQFLGLSALVLSALAKQPFALMPILGIGFVLWTQPLKSALKTIAISLVPIVLVLAALILAWPKFPEFLLAMLHQTTATSTAGDLFSAGIKSYFLPAILFILPAFGLIYLAKKSPALCKVLSWALPLGLAMLPFAHFVLAMARLEFIAPKLGYPQALLLSAVLLWFLEGPHWSKQQKAAWLLSIGLAWCSGISWGYAFPVLVALPGILALLIWFKRKLSFPLGARYLGAMVLLSMTGFLLLGQLPYREAPSWQLQGDAGKVFPRLSGIWTGVEGMEKLQEFRSLLDRHGPDFEMLPAHPAAHYLSKTQPMLRVDWAHDAEMPPDMLHANIELLAQGDLPVFVEKSRLAEASSDNRHYRSSLLAYVLENFQAIDSSQHYLVYQSMAAKTDQP